MVVDDNDVGEAVPASNKALDGRSTALASEARHDGSDAVVQWIHQLCTMYIRRILVRLLCNQQCGREIIDGDGLLVHVFAHRIELANDSASGHVEGLSATILLLHFIEDELEAFVADVVDGVAVEVSEKVIVHLVSEAIPLVSLVDAAKHIEGLLYIDFFEQITKMVAHLRLGVEFFHKHHTVRYILHHPAHHFFELPVWARHPPHRVTKLID